VNPQTISMEHVGIWVRDLERMRLFYVEKLGAESGELYENAGTGFRSYFLSFGEGARLEIMSRPAAPPADKAEPPSFGYAHIAFRLGTRAAVDERVSRLASQGVVISGHPRVTGDGYYEAVLEDPEGNHIELMA
jgi:lactoylglutathione lyase